MAKKICRQLKGNMSVKQTRDSSSEISHDYSNTSSKETAYSANGSHTTIKYCVRASIFKQSVKKAAKRVQNGLGGIQSILDLNKIARAGKILIITQNLIDKLAYQYAFRGLQLEFNVTFKFSLEDASAALSDQELDADRGFTEYALVFIDEELTRKTPLKQVITTLKKQRNRLTQTVPRVVYLSSQPLSKERTNQLKIDYNLVKPLCHKDLVELIQTAMVPEKLFNQSNLSLGDPGYDADRGLQSKQEGNISSLSNEQSNHSRSSLSVTE